jgi:hypothetical protein
MPGVEITDVAREYRLMKSEPHHLAPGRDHDRLIAFLHIPKTAGTTLNSILAHRFAPHERYKIAMRGISLTAPRFRLLPRRLISPSNVRDFKTSLAERHELREVHGHFDMSLGKLLPPRAELITVVRDPVERAISHYCHFRRRPCEAVHPLALRSTLVEWVTARGLVEMDNGQTRRLAGETNLPIGGVSAKTLDKAKTHLEKFKLVGLTERFDEFQVLLHRELNWSYCRYPARNVGDGRHRQKQFDAQELAAVEHFNQFDRELYRFAAELFEDRIAGIDMNRELALLNNAAEYRAPTPPALVPQRIEPAATRPPGRFQSLFGLPWRTLDMQVKR